MDFFWDLLRNRLPWGTFCRLFILKRLTSQSYIHYHYSVNAQHCIWCRKQQGQAGSLRKSWEVSERKEIPTTSLCAMPSLCLYRCKAMAIPDSSWFMFIITAFIGKRGVAFLEGCVLQLWLLTWAAAATMKKRDNFYPSSKKTPTNSKLMVWTLLSHPLGTIKSSNQVQ